MVTCARPPGPPVSRRNGQAAGFGVSHTGKETTSIATAATTEKWSATASPLSVGPIFRIQMTAKAGNRAPAVRAPAPRHHAAKARGDRQRNAPTHPLTQKPGREQGHEDRPGGPDGHHITQRNPA